MHLLDSIALIRSIHANTVIVSGSHGGRSAAEFVIAMNQKPSCVFFNDAGGGKEAAGLIALEVLQSHGVSCACYSHMTARIGDAQDGYSSGIISALNPLARSLGIELHMSVKQAVALQKIKSS